MIITAREVWLKDGEHLTLRSPLPADAATLLDHLKDVSTDSHRNMNHTADHWAAYPLEKEIEVLELFSKAENKFMISAFAQDGRIVGGIGCMGVERSRFLTHNARIGMGIRTAYQNRGLGTLLLRTVMFEAPKLGFKRLELTVRAFNEPGIKLYEKLGFRRVGRLSGVAFIDGEYCDEFLYEIKL